MITKNCYVQWKAYTCRQTSLHVSGPSHCPRVDIPHPAAIPGPRSAVRASAWTRLSPGTGNGSCVTHRDYRQLSDDVFDRQYIKNWAPGVELVNDSRILTGAKKIFAFETDYLLLFSFCCILDLNNQNNRQKVVNNRNTRNNRYNRNNSAGNSGSLPSAQLAEHTFDGQH